MLTGLPNFIFTFGYTNASWTLRADLVSQYTCRLLKYMDKEGQTVVWPVEPDTAERLPFLEDLVSGYVTRAENAMPHQVPLAPWRSYQITSASCRCSSTARSRTRVSVSVPEPQGRRRPAGNASHEAPVAIGR